jgi:hypothetical protein
MKEAFLVAACVPSVLYVLVALVREIRHVLAQKRANREYHAARRTRRQATERGR